MEALSCFEPGPAERPKAALVVAQKSFAHVFAQAAGGGSDAASPLAALQQALALLAGEAPAAAPSAAAASAAAAAASINGSELMSVMACVTPQEMQMAKSLHAALKVVALLDSLSASGNQAGQMV
ncbi:hypothetical protein TSOC_004798 [Tetrabaena socialis]|uniref:Uncharacterized protein n=1 Tax=Tetrabaena socialis TaxID=47790 RepID=A0A2J8A811_9CHLO|nr:hypothetical protein TSOC_004798 [Tetrabaena socialis]|eukprot:PNH08648.1 hypothetical protein TSOC_004798 [Tetrabaena socialis]